MLRAESARRVRPDPARCAAGTRTTSTCTWYTPFPPRAEAGFRTAPSSGARSPSMSRRVRAAGGGALSVPPWVLEFHPRTRPRVLSLSLPGFLSSIPAQGRALGPSVTAALCSPGADPGPVVLQACARAVLPRLTQRRQRHQKLHRQLRFPPEEHREPRQPSRPCSVALWS